MGRQKRPFPLGHFRLRYPKNYDKPLTCKDKGEDFITFVLKRLDSEYSRNKIGYSRYKNGQSCINIFL